MADYQVQQGLNTGLQSFWDAFKDERNRSQDLEYKKAALAQAKAKQEKEDAFNREKMGESSLLEARGKGLIPEKDASGKVTGYKYDPEFFKLKSESDPYKSLLSGLSVQQKMGDINEQKVKAEKEAKLKTPEGRVEAASGDVKQKIGFASVGRQAGKNLLGLLDAGHEPSRLNPSTPLIGSFVDSDPIYQNLQVMAEQYGRLQSGGAINKDEETRFLARGPRPGDSPETRKAKVQQMVDEFETKAGIYGATPGVLDSYAAAKPAQQKNGPSLVNEAQAAGAGSPPPGLSFEQFKAWKQKNAK